MSAFTPVGPYTFLYGDGKGGDGPIHSLSRSYTCTVDGTSYAVTLRHAWPLTDRRGSLQGICRDWQPEMPHLPNAIQQEYERLLHAFLTYLRTYAQKDMAKREMWKRRNSLI